MSQCHTQPTETTEYVARRSDGGELDVSLLKLQSPFTNLDLLVVLNEQVSSEHSELLNQAQPKLNQALWLSGKIVQESMRRITCCQIRAKLKSQETPEKTFTFSLAISYT